MWVRGWGGEALVFSVITYSKSLESDVQRRTQGDFAQNAFLMTNSSEANATLKEKLRLGFVVLMTRMYAIYRIIVTLWPI